MYKLISVDDHILEPADVWTSRLPADLRDVGPHIVVENGVEFWEWENGNRGATMGLVATAGRPQEEWDPMPITYARMLDGCYDPKSRAEDLRADGVIGSLGFPTLPRFAGTLFLDFKDKNLADLSVKAWNDFVLDEWCAAAPDLFIPMIITQLWDPELAASEIYRNAEKGCRGIAFPENTVGLGLPSYYTDHWDPVWRACVETQTVVNMHVGTSGGLPQPSPEAEFSLTIILAQVNSQIALMNLIHSPVPKKFPELQIVLSEGGISWIPSILERADHMFENHNIWAHLDITMRPSEIFRQNFYGACLYDRHGVLNRHAIGVDRILWESDYPHSETAWPHSQKRVAEVFADVPEDEVDKMTHGNAQKLYRWGG
jgi:predicted TIM-barrel fold metal-dependent hydrolase